MFYFVFIPPQFSHFLQHMDSVSIIVNDDVWNESEHTFQQGGKSYAHHLCYELETESCFQREAKNRLWNQSSQSYFPLLEKQGKLLQGIRKDDGKV